MYIEKLYVKNFRCFEEAEVLFEYAGRHAKSKAPRLPNVNLILGDNGTGKSAILTAITLSVLGRVIQSTGFRPYLLVRRTGQNGGVSSGQQESATVQTRIRLHPQDAVEIPETWESETIGSIAGLSIINRLADTETLIASSQDGPGKWKPLYEDASPAFFLAAYGASRRVSSAETFELPELAALSGVSVSTLKREFSARKDGTPTNPHLHRFVQRERQVHQDMTGRIIRTPNVYVIKMDDPLHEMDQPKLEAELEKRADKSRIAQNEPYGKSRMAQNDPRTAQNEPLYKVGITPTTKEILQTPAAPPGVLPSASGEKPNEKTPDKSADKTDQQRQVYQQGTRNLKAALEKARKKGESIQI